MSRGGCGLADVFISYARSDEAVARRVAKALQSAGLDVWWDADLPAHRAYSEVIERNLADAKAVVVLWSKSAAASQWVRAEADFARNAGKLVQAQLDGTLPPIPFNQIQCADLKGWRGNPRQSGWAKLEASVNALISGEEQPVAATVRSNPWQRLQSYRLSIVALLALVVAAGVYLYAFRTPGEQRKPVLAVLPFRSLDPQDASLVSGIWEDTRTAIGRNPQLIVLGPNTTEQLASKGEGAAKKAADYILEASVRSSADRVRVTADLVRTRDGEQVWSQDFDRKLDDIFALQSEIAGEIEGRIRGRLAEKGGITPEHIATTGEVYALYSDARAKLRKRDNSLYPSAIRELDEVTRKDPNFAPGWATYSVLMQLALPSQRNYRAFQGAEAFARKAIELAPNLAEGHAALAFALGLQGPVARAEIERAVELDPNDYQSILWLGNMKVRAGDKNGAIADYLKAVKIEPLFWPAVLNLVERYKDLNDRAGIQQLLEYEKRVGGGYFATMIEVGQAYDRGDLVRSLNLAIDAYAEGGPEARNIIANDLWSVLLQLGFVEDAVKLGPVPDFAKALWQNDPAGLDMVESHHMTPEDFFSFTPLPQNAGRVYILTGRSRKLADMYLSLHATPDEFLRISNQDDVRDVKPFLYSAPLVVVALRQNGHSAEAARLLSTLDPVAQRNARSGTPLSSALLARVYALEGRRDDAISLLAAAANRNWLPEPPLQMLDLDQDPALAPIRTERRFRAIRQQILDRVARMRAQVHIQQLRQARAA